MLQNLIFYSVLSVSSVVNPSRFGLLRASNLPLGFIQRDADRCRQVQAPRIRLHGDRQTHLCIFPQERLGQTARFPSENQKIPILEGFIPIHLRCFCREIEVSSRWLGGLEFCERCPAFHIAEMPIIHPRTAKSFFIQREPQWLHQMQPRPGRETQPCNIPRIRRNLRLNKHDMKHGHILRAFAVGRNSIRYMFHVEHKLNHWAALGAWRSPGGTTSVSSQASSAKRRRQRCTDVSAVKDTRVATSSMTRHTSRPHGRDDHSPLFRAVAKTLNAHTKNIFKCLHDNMGFLYFTGAQSPDFDVFEHGITSDTVGKIGGNPQTRCW